MLTKNGINSPKDYITNDDKPWPWKFLYLSTHEKMKSKMGLWVHLGKIYNIIYIKCCLNKKLKDLTKHPEEVGVNLYPGI